MSGIARLLLEAGERISGSDAHDSPMLESIRRLGGEVRIGHQASHLNGADRVVYSSSIGPENPELVLARNRGVPVLHRSQIAAELLRGFRLIAVTGAHGKSTTSALAAELLLRAGLDPTALIGTEDPALGGNARWGKGRHAVVEADESDASFLWFEPQIAILTNIDEEHLDYFRNGSEIMGAYAAFAARVKPGGWVIGCGDDPCVRRILSSCRRRTLTYGFSEEAEFTARQIQLEAGGSRYLCFRSGRKIGAVRLRVAGLHNVVNSLAAVALGHRLGIGFQKIRLALEQFQGTKRRFQIQGEPRGILVVEDYGHHPTEIATTLEAARTWPGRRLRCVFQPHRYSRTRYLMRQFASCFRAVDELILLPIYAASEEPLSEITSERLQEEIRSGSRVPVCLRTPEEALEQLASDAKAGDLILFLGAGSVGSLAGKLVERLREDDRNGS